MIIGFDLDGTLIDTIGLHKEAFVDSASKIGLNLCGSDFFRAQSTTAEQMIRSVAPSITDSELGEFIRLKNEYLKEHFGRIKPFPDTVQVLSELRKSANIMIFSNSDFKEVLVFLEAAGLNPLFFDLIVGKDLVSQPKPSADEIFVAERLSHHKVDYYVGDSVVDIIAGRNAKVRTIAVATGFNSREELAKERPYKVIDSLSGLPEIVRRRPD